MHRLFLPVFSTDRKPAAEPEEFKKEIFCVVTNLLSCTKNFNLITAKESIYSSQQNFTTSRQGKGCLRCAAGDSLAA